MKHNFSTKAACHILEAALGSQSADQLLDIINSALRDHEKSVFCHLFGIGCPKQDIESLAQSMGCSPDQVQDVLTRLLLKILRRDDTASILQDMNEKGLLDQQEDKEWNTEPGSALYFMNGQFYVNRDPYEEDKEAPSCGIPFNHSNEVALMNMSDFHTTAVVLGQGDKRGIFVFESSWGMQGFRYVSDDTEEPFPYDEVRFCDAQSDAGYHVGYFAYRIGSQWGIMRLGDSTCPYRRHDCVPLGELSLEDAVRKLCKYRRLDPNWVWEKV